MFNSEIILELLQNYPVGYLKPDHIFFKTTNTIILKTYKKLGAINNKDETCISTNHIYCNEFNCTMAFDNISSYQSHYSVMHRFSCAECRKSFPTDHLLDLHLSESHDSYFTARIKRGERLFKCYLEECEETFGNSYERKEHCIIRHKFPSNFRFDQIGLKDFTKKDGVSEKKMEPVVNLEKLKKWKSRETKFSFGHQTETFFSNEGSRQKQGSNKSLENMDTLKQALELK